MLTPEEQIERIADAALVASHDHADPALVVQPRSWFNRRSWVGVAAAVMLIGLVGALVGVVVNTDRGSDTADAPPSPTVPVALGQAENLGESDWVIATVLPDGVEYLYPLAGEGGATRTVWYGTRRDDGTSEQLRVSAGLEEPLGTGEQVDIDGVAWTVSESGSGRWSAARPVGTDVVSVSAPGVFDATAQSVLEGLAVVPVSALPSPPLGPRDQAAEVASTEFDGDRHSLAVQESNGYACTWAISSDGSISGGCGVLVDPSALLAITAGSGSQADNSDVIEVAIGGSVTNDATRVEVEFVDGTTVSAIPGDLSGQFDQHFWIVAADVGRDTVTGQTPTDHTVKQARAYGADGQLIATATQP